jgi:hypothetical protein
VIRGKQLLQVFWGILFHEIQNCFVIEMNLLYSKNQIVTNLFLQLEDDFEFLDLFSDDSNSSLVITLAASILFYEADAVNRRLESFFKYFFI